MFSTKELLTKKTPTNGIGRKEFIANLIEEFYNTTNIEAQQQVSANIANFAYDPINYNFLQQSSAVDLFLQLIVLPDDKLVLHGIAGLCNICLDPSAFKEITKTDNLNLILAVLHSNKNTDTLINLLTLLHMLLSEDSSLKVQICSSKNLKTIANLKRSQEKRLELLSTVFLEDFAPASITV